MRKTMFRGITVNGDWVYGNLNILKKERPDGIAPGYYISNSDGRFPFAYAVIPETVYQDKNNVDIYGGDIAKIKNSEGIITITNIQWSRGRYVIEWNRQYSVSRCICTETRKNSR